MLLGKHEVSALSPDEIYDSISEDVALVSLSHTDFRTSTVRDMQAITERAHEKGALVLWDLSHSVGVMPLRVDELDVDFAVGCTYKYLNGTAGCPGFVYMNEKHHEGFQPKVVGWLGHDKPFSFEAGYRPASGVQSLHTGTQAVLTMQNLGGSLKDFKGVDMADLRRYGAQLTGELIERVPALIPGSKCLTPTEPHNRGGHVAIWHEEAEYISRALIGHAHVITDFRAYGEKGGFFRLCPHPLYTNFADIDRTCDLIEEVVSEGIYKRKKYCGARKTKVS